MLEVRALVKEFGGLRAVDDVSFTLRANTITVSPARLSTAAPSQPAAATCRVSGVGGDFADSSAPRFSHSARSSA